MFKNNFLCFPVVFDMETKQLKNTTAGVTRLSLWSQIAWVNLLTFTFLCAPIAVQPKDNTSGFSPDWCALTNIFWL